MKSRLKSPLESVAKKLVSRHRRDLPDLRQALFYPDPQGKELRLLEVVTSSPSSGEVHPFKFAPNPELGYPFPTVLIELSPAEFRKLGRNGGNLRLPADWENPVVLFTAK